MKRRLFTHHLALAAATLNLGCHAQKSWALDGPSPWAAIERRVGGRLGVAVLDTATGRTEGHRLDERFPMCSTFKWLAAAAVLQRVDQGVEQLQRLIRYDRGALIAYSPVAEQHLADGMTMAQLCEAAVTLSDNAAANLILDTLGGPAGVTRFARSLGDTVTRLDRTEPTLNEGLPGDPRDTTSPRAMAGALQAAVLGTALQPASRAQLAQWLVDCKTGDARLRQGAPASWRVGDKTGTGDRGTTNDVAVFWPPERAPVVMAAYLTGSRATAAQRNQALADSARLAVQRLAATPR